MILAPETFNGTWGSLYEQYVEPNLLSADIAEDVHAWFLRFCADSESTFIVRAAGTAQRRQTYVTCDGTRIAPADNSPGVALYGSRASGAIRTYDEFQERMRSLPVHIHDAGNQLTATKLRWYTAHIFSAKKGDTDFASWTRSEVIRRFLAALHPCNMFFVPNTHGNGRVSGEDPRVIGYFAERFSRRYASIWPQVLSALCVSPMTNRNDMHAEPCRLHREMQPTTPHNASDGYSVRYSAARLIFKRAVIEPLGLDERFVIDTTTSGSFCMSKREFLDVFANVAASNSYAVKAMYSYTQVPAKAEVFRISF